MIGGISGGDGVREADVTAGSAARSADALRVHPLAGRPGWQAAGEISLLTRPVWERLLNELVQSEEAACHLELSAVTFVDVAGVSALAVAAQSLPEGRHVMIEQPPAVLRRVLDTFWPGLPAIKVVA
ncbi:STAS domain-containing protein [Streptomyces sp. NPDC020983]|uniref:STAS domain-containing protein n=1 Tax=Streptomyces sp. NPDC020983 TaxID=3365106 RepID=UPI00379B45A8